MGKLTFLHDKMQDWSKLKAVAETSYARAENDVGNGENTGHHGGKGEITGSQKGFFSQDSNNPLPDDKNFRLVQIETNCR